MLGPSGVATPGVYWAVVASARHLPNTHLPKLKHALRVPGDVPATDPCLPLVVIHYVDPRISRTAGAP